jgi:transcriptional regulator with GAF, ATPase, and Fis domain
MVPPLRECGEDILVLAKAFLYCYATESQRKISGYEPSALTALKWQAVDDSLKSVS